MENVLAVLERTALSPKELIFTPSAILVVLLVEILRQGKDNSFNVLRRSAVTRRADGTGILLTLSSFIPALVVLFSVFVAQAGMTKLGIRPLIGPATTPVEAVARAVAAFVALDFLGYWAHRLDHELAWSWIGHRFHHSATEVNIASGWRFHPLNVLSWCTVITLPHTLLFGPYRFTLFIVILIELRRAWGHSRLDTDFGWLGVVIVSPLFHRRHHDVHDSKCNYGDLLTCWDRLFGTYRAPDERTINAPTGIAPGSPYENQGPLRNLVGDTVDLFFYLVGLPFRAWRAASGGFRAG